MKNALRTFGYNLSDRFIGVLIQKFDKYGKKYFNNNNNITVKKRNNILITYIYKHKWSVL